MKIKIIETKEVIIQIPNDLVAKYAYYNSSNLSENGLTLILEEKLQIKLNVINIEFLNTKLGFVEYLVKYINE